MKKALFSTLTLLLSGALHAAITTQSLNYQGQLTDLSDQPQSGSHNFSFELYPALTGGVTPLWSTVINSVTVTRGLFNVDLDLTSLPRTAAVLNSTLYLQVTVDGQILSPRKQLLTGMFALNSDRLQGYEPGNGANQLPILDGSGRLNPGVVSAPFPLAVSGSGSASSAVQAASIINTDTTTGQVGVTIAGYDAAVSATANSASGTGVIATTSASDGSSANGVWGKASNGVGVRATSAALNSAALVANSTSGLGAYSTGVYGGQMVGTTLGLRIGGAGLGGQAGGTPATGLEVNSSLEGIVVNNSGANPGVKATAQGTGPAVQGNAATATSTGVHGNHTGGGAGKGVWGASSSASGTGVLAENTNAAGTGPGLKAQVASTAALAVDASSPGTAVKAQSTGLTGVTYGLKAQADSTDGQAARGDAGGAGAAYGLYGSAPLSASGAGVYGTSSNHGVWGQSTSVGSGYGIYGLAANVAVRGQSTQASGSYPQALGVYGTTNSVDGTGVYGEAVAGSAGNAVGVQGKALASGGTGVYGQGSLRGVYGIASGGNGHGVEGDAGPANSGDGRAGVYGSALAGSGELVYGVYGSVSGSSASAYGIFAKALVAQAKAAQVVNFAAQASSSGYALDVEGKFRVGTDNAKYYIGPASAQTQWTVITNYCGVGDLVLVTPQVDITSGGTVNNSFWVGPGDVGDGYFIVNTAQSVSNMRFQYLVIDK